MDEKETEAATGWKCVPDQLDHLQIYDFSSSAETQKHVIVDLSKTARYTQKSEHCNLLKRSGRRDNYRLEEIRQTPTP